MVEYWLSGANGEADVSLLTGARSNELVYSPLYQLLFSLR